MRKDTELDCCVRAALDDYFKCLDGGHPHAVYDMVLHAVEKPMLQYVLNLTNGNQSKASEILGLNRNTLRKKLKDHGIE
jgi:Fis family transcriptional regulator